MVSELEGRMLERIKSEVAKINEGQEQIKKQIDKRVGEQHGYMNELKDELDRVGDRVKAN